MFGLVPICWPPMSPFHRSERGKAGVLVQDLDLVEANVAEQIELKDERPRRVLALDIGKHLLAVGVIPECGQILPIAAAE